MNHLQQNIYRKFFNAIPGTPLIADKLSGSIVEKGLSRTAGNLKVRGQQAKTVTAKVAPGNPLVNLNLDSGMQMAASFTLVYDMSAVGGGTGSGFTEIVLFDVHKWHQFRNGIANPVPAGIVYHEDPVRNTYSCIVDGLCNSTKHLFGFSVRASAVAGATIGEKQQVNQELIHWMHNEDGADYRKLKASQYYDPKQYDNSKQIVETKGRFSRIDQGTALTYKVYNGMIVEMDFFIAALTKD